VPATTREFVESVTCDLCGKVFSMADTDSDGINWEHLHDNVAKTGVFIGRGFNCPESTNIEFRDYHVCPECFENKLEPWLKAQGATFTAREIDW
jgi:hypothetical protein